MGSALYSRAVTLERKKIAEMAAGTWNQSEQVPLSALGESDPDSGWQGNTWG